MKQPSLLQSPGAVRRPGWFLNQTRLAALLLGCCVLRGFTQELPPANATLSLFDTNLAVLGADLVGDGSQAPVASPDSGKPPAASGSEESPVPAADGTASEIGRAHV